MPIDPALLSAELRRVRTAHGLTQRALAATLGVRQATIADWERGANQPDLASLDAVCQALGLCLWLGPGEVRFLPESAGETLLREMPEGE